MIAVSYNRDIIHGDAESRAHWFVYASSTVLAPKAVKQVGEKVDSKAKAGAQKAGQQLDDLLPYHPKHQMAPVGPVPYHVFNGGFFVDRLVMMAERTPGSLVGMSASGRRVGKGINKIEIRYPLSSTNIKHINKHNIDSIIKQSKYLTDTQLASKLESSFFNPKWSKNDIITYSEIAYSDLIKQGKTGHQTYFIAGETIDVFIHADGQFGTVYGRHTFTVDDIKNMAK